MVPELVLYGSAFSHFNRIFLISIDHNGIPVNRTALKFPAVISMDMAMDKVAGLYFPAAG